MSQEDVLNAIKDLGGKATTDQIREHIKKKYPKRTLYLYVTNRLKKLVENKKIRFNDGKWVIKK